MPLAHWFSKFAIVVNLILADLHGQDEARQKIQTQATKRAFDSGLMETPAMNAVLSKCRIARQVIVNAPEFSLTPRPREVTCNDGNCGRETNSLGRLGAWILSQALGLAHELVSGGKQVELNFIVNDFSLPPKIRPSTKATMSLHLPQDYRAALTQNGMQYRPKGEMAEIQFDSQFTVPVNFVAESTLRNKAKKLLKTFVERGLLNNEDGAIGLPLKSGALRLHTDDAFSYEPGSTLTLAKKGFIPVCSALVFAFYHGHSTSTIINVQEYRWKCGYRSGALALFNLLPNACAVHNAFFLSPDAHGLVTDDILPNVSPQNKPNACNPPPFVSSDPSRAVACNA